MTPEQTVLPSNGQFFLYYVRSHQFFSPGSLEIRQIHWFFTKMVRKHHQPELGASGNSLNSRDGGRLPRPTPSLLGPGGGVVQIPLE